MLQPLIIIGNSEIARMAYEYFTHDAGRQVVAFVADANFIREGTFQGLPVVDYAEVQAKYPPDAYDAFVAIGSGQLNRIRSHFFTDVKSKGYRLATYVSSKAFVWRDVSIGENCFILENNVLQSGVTIGDNVTLWSGNHIGHRSTIERHVFVSSHVVISGFCSVGEFSFMGVNSAVAEKTDIATDNFVAMGAVVTRSTLPDQVLIGNPAESHKVGAKRFCRVKG